MTSSSLNEDLDGRCDQELVRIPGGGIRIGSVENGTFALPVLHLFPREVLPVASRGLVIGRRQAGNDQKPRIQTAAEVRLVDEHSPTPERVPCCSINYSSPCFFVVMGRNNLSNR